MFGKNVKFLTAQVYLVVFGRLNHAANRCTQRVVERPARPSLSSSEQVQPLVAKWLPTRTRTYRRPCSQMQSVS